MGNLQEFWKWNPVFPALFLVYFISLLVRKGFSWMAAIGTGFMAVYLGLAIARLFSTRLRAMTAETGKRKRLSEDEVVKRVGTERLVTFLPSRFGQVMMSEVTRSGRRTIDVIVREEPEPGYSGWMLISSEEKDDGAEPEMHNCLEALRVAPELAEYLHLPPGTHLVRTGSRRFEPDPDAGG